MPGEVALTVLKAMSVADVEERMRNVLFPKRIRVREFFRDYDPLRKWRCTRAQFLRVLDISALKPTKREAEMLADHYTDPKAKDLVIYGDFCDRLEEVFNPKFLEQTPLREIYPPGTNLDLHASTKFHTPSDAFASGDPVASLESLLYRCALLCSTRAVVFKYFFEDFDHSRSGTVSKEQFLRQFPFKFTEDEMQVLLAHYGEIRHSQKVVRYRDFHEDISVLETSNHTEKIPQSTLVSRPSSRQWTRDDFSVTELIRAKVVEGRVRLREQFQDFDPLNKGECTLTQLGTVLSVLGIELSPVELQRLQTQEGFQGEDGRFNYWAFTDYVDEAFTLKGLEHEPTTRIDMPGELTTVPGRRNFQKLDADQEQAVRDVENGILRTVRVHGIDLRAACKNFDRQHRGHIKVAQFARALTTIGLPLTQADLELLSMKYCDMGNEVDINYMDLCEVCDPNVHRPASVRSGQWAPKVVNPSVYFRDGDVVPSRPVSRAA